MVRGILGSGDMIHLPGASLLTRTWREEWSRRGRSPAASPRRAPPGATIRPWLGNTWLRRWQTRADITSWKSWKLFYLKNIDLLVMWAYYEAVLLIRIQYPGSVAFFTPGSGSAVGKRSGSGVGKRSGSGSSMNNSDHISENLKYWNSLMWIRDPGWKKFISRINIPDPQHCMKLCMKSYA